MSKKRFQMSDNHQGDKKPEPVQSPPASPGTAYAIGHKITLGDQDQTSLREMEDLAGKMKTAIADLHMQTRRIQQQQEEIAAELIKVQENFVAKARDIATGLGIDVDDPTKGRWDLDTTTMTFTKVS